MRISRHQLFPAREKGEGNSEMEKDGEVCSVGFGVGLEREREREKSSRWEGRGGKGQGPYTTTTAHPHPSSMAKKTKENGKGSVFGVWTQERRRTRRILFLSSFYFKISKSSLSLFSVS